ncbi:hypothetical protein RRG08_034099 [Elysia crispata]|uniref:Uncharacterized protein n=1 Tax=Elysia crispata TaxID=231223 RepID=A0AAE0ZCP6_9GAST|nr:hypothetical protein RRG08_034099 [Elysia crispata]
MGAQEISLAISLLEVKAKESTDFIQVEDQLETSAALYWRVLTKALVVIGFIDGERVLVLRVQEAPAYVESERRKNQQDLNSTCGRSAGDTGGGNHDLTT